MALVSQETAPLEWAAKKSQTMGMSLKLVKEAREPCDEPDSEKHFEDEQSWAASPWDLVSILMYGLFVSCLPILECQYGRWY